MGSLRQGSAKQCNAVIPPRASVSCTAQASHPLPQILQCFEIWNKFLLFCPFPTSPMYIPLTDLCYWGLGRGNGSFSMWECRWDGQKCFLWDWRTESQCITKHCCQLHWGTSVAPRCPCALLFSPFCEISEAVRLRGTPSANILTGKPHREE